MGELEIFLNCRLSSVDLRNFTRRFHIRVYKALNPQGVILGHVYNFSENLLFFLKRSELNKIRSTIFSQKEFVLY